MPLQERFDLLRLLLVPVGALSVAMMWYLYSHNSRPATLQWAMMSSSGMPHHTLCVQMCSQHDMTHAGRVSGHPAPPPPPRS